MVRLGRRELIAFIALGLVSLFADMTYEGARSVLGAYLDVLGAGAVVAGSVAVGDFLGYVARGAGGMLAHRLRSGKAYWALVFLGYGINLFAVPALAFAGNWGVALALILIERIGKGLRTPARDTILAEVTEGMGKGKGFGLHEVMDQTGAVAGPAFVGYALFISGGTYSEAFKMLFIPALAALLMLSIAFINYPSLRGISGAKGSEERRASLGRSFWLYTVAMSLLALGFMHWSLIAFHLKACGVMKDYEIAYMYVVAMLADAAVAFPAGYLYDKFGPRTLIIAPFLAFAAPATLLWPGFSGVSAVLIAAVVWGVLMGLYETNMRVTVADVVRPELRAYAYGMYGMIFGVSWAAGNALMGALYPVSTYALLAFIALVEAASLATLTLFLRGFRAS